MANSGYLGGNVSMAERHRLRDKHLAPIAHRAVDQGLRRQCRCGGTLYVKWRGRWYCPRDGRWVAKFPERASSGKGE